MKGKHMHYAVTRGTLVAYGLVAFFAGGATGAVATPSSMASVATARPCHPAHPAWHRVGDTANRWAYMSAGQAKGHHYGCKATQYMTPFQTFYFDSAGHLVGKS